MKDDSLSFLFLPSFCISNTLIVSTTIKNFSQLVSHLILTTKAKMVVPLLVAPHVLVQEGNHLSAPESNGDIRPIQNYGAYAPTTGANRDILPMQEITQVGYGSRADEQMDNTKAASHLTVTRLDKLGKDAEFIDCPYCQERTQTYVVRTNSTMTQ